MAAGFTFEVINADDYDALRPDYAPEAAAWVAERGRLGRGSLVLDLAAGTGRLSKRFALPGVKLVAVEPARNMRRVVEDRLPEVRVLDGSAEGIPLGDGEADAVVVGNAFHHFDARRAFGEIWRVLRAGGVLALFWARTDGAVYSTYPQFRVVDAAVQRARGAAPAAAAIAAALGSWRLPPRRVPGFTPFEQAKFPMVQAIPSARLADLYATSSDVASLPPSIRTELLARIREISREFPDVLELPRYSVVHLCVRETADR